MALISIKRVVAARVIHRKTVSSGIKVTSGKTIIEARAGVFSLKKLITIRVIWTEVMERLRIVVAEI